MNAGEIARFTAVQRIPLPKDMPGKRQESISAVTYFVENGLLAIADGVRGNNAGAVLFYIAKEVFSVV